MADQPSIESLLADLLSLFSVAGWTDHDLLDAISELSALRAENERLTAWAQGTESTMHGLRAENDALAAELEECKSKRKAFIEEVKGKLLDRDALLANWNRALEERDAERARADALAARVEALRPWAAHLEGCSEQENGPDTCDCGLSKVLRSTPPADLGPEPREEREAAAAKVDELAALVRQLVRSLRKHSPDNETARRAMDYLKRHELQGSPLRGLSPAPDAAKPNNQQEQP